MIESYQDPIETFSTNVIGTAHLLECARLCKSVKAIVNITTDKCYENKEWVWPYRETDRLGGQDPYSASKACSELVTQSFYKSFFEKKNIQVATARAGNVIGGGDGKNHVGYTNLSNNQNLKIRSPNSIPSWQHVLAPVEGYILLAEQLYTKEKYCGAWNFGEITTRKIN